MNFLRPIPCNGKKQRIGARLIACGFIFNKRIIARKFFCSKGN